MRYVVVKAPLVARVRIEAYLRQVDHEEHIMRLVPPITTPMPQGII